MTCHTIVWDIGSQKASDLFLPPLLWAFGLAKTGIAPWEVAIVALNQEHQ